MTKQYKPFNLEAANAGAKLITRDGQAVTEFHHFKTMAGRYPCAAIIDGERSSFNVDGQLFDYETNSKDLFMAPVERTVYVNLYEDIAFQKISNAAWHPTPEKAKKAIDDSRTLVASAVPVTITE